MLSNGDSCFITGRRLSRNILSESLLISILLPISFKESKYCWSVSTAVNFGFPSFNSCWLLFTRAPFHILIVTCYGYHHLQVRNKTSKRSSYLHQSTVQFSAKHWLRNLGFCANNAKHRKFPRGPSLGE